MAFDVRLSAPSGVQIQVQAALRRGVTGTATPGADFVTPATTRLTFLPGETLKTFVVNVNGDTLREGDETFGVELISAFSATLGDATAVGTIVDDDGGRVVGRHVFYNNSRFDGADPAANAADDAAVAPKAALLPGESASFANVTNYSKGINGVMIDVLGANVGTLSADDFYFKVRAGNGAAGWVAAPAPATIAVRPSLIPEQPTRVTLTWPDGAVRNTWLRVTMKANDHTGLAREDAFSFGNLVAETGDGNTAGALTVGIFDLIKMRRNLFSLAPVSSLYDVNRDGRVNSLDLALAVRAAGQRLLLADASPVLAPQPTDPPAGLRIADQVLK
jgi:hypothetical protein